MEYILAFGAASVIVLTIIIVLILYLILQCRSQRRKRRAARASGLACDSNSGSFMERSTIDFIVPGEMELTSAVRSVSCNNGLKNGLNGLKKPEAADEKDGGSGNDGDDEEDYGGLGGLKKYKNQPPSYRQPPPYVDHGAVRYSLHQPPPYGGCQARNSQNFCCPCCGEAAAQPWFQPHFQPQPFPRPPYIQQRPQIMMPDHNLGNFMALPRQPFFYPANNQQPQWPQQPLRPPMGILKTQQGWVVSEEAKYGAFSDTEVEKGLKGRTVRSRSLPRRPASSMTTIHPHHGPHPHFVTLSRAATVEAVEHYQFGGRGGHRGHHGGHGVVRYSSTPQLNGILEFSPLMVAQNRPPVPVKPKFTALKTMTSSEINQQQPKYQQPVCQQQIQNSEYLFPDLPPPPDALLENFSPPPPSQELQPNSR